MIIPKEAPTSRQTDGEATPEVEVIVTGFGPFRTIKTNPSYELITRLPPRIPSASASRPDIIVQAYPEPVKVAYPHVHKLVPQLYKDYPHATFFVHVGVHAGISWLRLERRARKGPYYKKDVDEGCFPGEHTECNQGWGECVEELISDIDADEIVERMTKDGKWDVDASDDAGLYLCEFIYFNSMLAASRLKDEGRRVRGLFIHIPDNLDPAVLDSERDTLVQIIREMVQQASSSE